MATAEQTRLGTAINTIATKYLGNVIKAGDSPGILKWSTRLADYATRLAALVAPPLTQAEAAEVAVEATLSADPTVAIAQLLAASGNPLTFNAEGATIGIDPANVIAGATEQQVRELALLGFFGQPGLHANVDYSLFERYYEKSPETGLDINGQPLGGSWVPKDPNTGAWQAYSAEQED